MNPKRKDLIPTEDPSIFTCEGRLYHVPRSFGMKLAYLIVGAAVFALGLWFLKDPALAVLLGSVGEGRIVRIVKTVPGAEDQTIRHRRTFTDERDRSITFRHYVEVRENGSPRVLRLSVDSRVKPYANINDRLQVCHRPGRDIAFQAWHIRTWGIGILYAVVGTTFLGIGIPMLLAVGKPILIDPDAPPDTAADSAADPSDKKPES